MSPFQPADGYQTLWLLKHHLSVGDLEPLDSWKVHFTENKIETRTCPGHVPGYWVSTVSSFPLAEGGGSRSTCRAPCLHLFPLLPSLPCHLFLGSVRASSFIRLSLPPLLLLLSYLHPCFLASPLSSITGATAAERCQNSPRCRSAWRTVTRRPCIAAGGERDTAVLLVLPADRILYTLCLTKRKTCSWKPQKKVSHVLLVSLMRPLLKDGD